MTCVITAVTPYLQRRVCSEAHSKPSLPRSPSSDLLKPFYRPSMQDAGRVNSNPRIAALWIFFFGTYIRAAFGVSAFVVDLENVCR